MWWGYKQSDLHRLSRDRPWWENIALSFGTVGFVVVAAIAYYVGNRLYYYVRPAGNDLLVIQRLDEKVFSRPDLSVALVKMALHHIFSKTETPFAAPMVAPPELQDEALQLLHFIKELHKEQPQFSIPDLWVMATAKAVERIGGPALTALRGRKNQDSFEDKDLLVFPPSCISDSARDVLSFKRMMSVSGYSFEEAIVALGAARSIGFHSVANIHFRESMKPANLRERFDENFPSQETLMTQKEATMRKCSMDPFVFGGEYFTYLLDYIWEPRVEELNRDGSVKEKKGILSKLTLFKTSSSPVNSSESQGLVAPSTRTYWTCSESKRRRVEQLVNPLSEEYLRKAKRKIELNAKQLREQEEQEELERLQNGDQVSPVISPCDHITMEAVDVMLMDDALTLGWLSKFSENELRYYGSFAKLMDKLFQKGYNANLLFNLKRV